MTVPPGPLVASGRDADVYEYDDGLVLRRYRRPRSTEREVAAMRAAAAAGYPVPTVHHADDTDMVLDRVDGPTMLADLARRPGKVFDHARTLARLHRDLNGVIAPREVPARFGSGGVLLHMDLHPENVIMSAAGPVVIDWANAAAGDPEADVAQTWIIMATSEIPGGWWQRAVASSGRTLFVRRFLRDFDREAVVRHLPDVGAARIRDGNVLDSERAAIRHLIDRHVIDKHAT